MWFITLFLTISWISAVHGWSILRIPRITKSFSGIMRHSTACIGDSSILSDEVTATAARHKRIETHWRQGFISTPREVCDEESLTIDLPNDFPAGTYYRNGYGRLHIGEGERQQVVHHPFDGDGMITAITFTPPSDESEGETKKENDKRRLLFRSRFVQTEGYLQDTREGRFCTPGVFGTQTTTCTTSPSCVTTTCTPSDGTTSDCTTSPCNTSSMCGHTHNKWWHKLFPFLLPSSLNVNVKNVANTNVILWANRPLALWEGGLPYSLDPTTLETKGTFSWKKERSLSTVWTAHPKIDPLNNRLITFSMDRGLLGAKLRVLEI